MTAENKKIIIAIDGPAASGKGSLAKKLAQELDFDFLDTGALYRRVALDMMDQGFNPHDEGKAVETAQAFDAETLNLDDERIRSDEVGSNASKVARYDGVRAALFDFQRNFAKNAQKGAVLDGRDIATNIYPEANFKLYVTASAEKRAERRHKELQSRGIHATYGDVLADMRERDTRDVVQLDKHFVQDHENIMIDTTDMTPEQVLEEALKIVNESHS